MIGLFFRLCFRLRQRSFHWIISDGVISGIGVLFLTSTVWFSLDRIALRFWLRLRLRHRRLWKPAFNAHRMSHHLSIAGTNRFNAFSKFSFFCRRKRRNVFFTISYRFHLSTPKCSKTKTKKKKNSHTLFHVNPFKCPFFPTHINAMLHHRFHLCVFKKYLFSSASSGVVEWMIGEKE